MREQKPCRILPTTRRWPEQKTKPRHKGRGFAWPVPEWLMLGPRARHGARLAAAARLHSLLVLLGAGLRLGTELVIGELFLVGRQFVVEVVEGGGQLLQVLCVLLRQI